MEITGWKEVSSIGGRAELSTAMNRFYNKLGGPVFGQNKHGEWKQIYRTKKEKDLIYAQGHGSEEWFLLHGIKSEQESLINRVKSKTRRA